jgi:hypothetical protein
MQTKTKLALLELIGGIFGWVWIISFLAALYFLAMAIFSDGPWSRFFWAFGIGAVAKWLTRGLRDNQARVAFEAKLVAEGYTPEQAAKEWTSRYMGGDRT